MKIENQDFFKLKDPKPFILYVSPKLYRLLLKKWGEKNV